MPASVALIKHLHCLGNGVAEVQLSTASNPDCTGHDLLVDCCRPESAGPPIERRSRDYGGRGDYSRGRGSSEGWTSGNDRRGQSFGGDRPEPADLEW